MFSFPFDPAATVFIGFILFTFALLLITKRRNDLKRENLEDDMPEQAEIHAVELNGRTIWLSNSDLEIWKGLNNFQKKAIVDKQINAIKNGRWVKVMNDNMDCTGIITREEALRTGYLLEVEYPDGSVKLWNKHELKAYQQQNKNNQLIKT